MTEFVSVASSNLQVVLMWKLQIHFLVIFFFPYLSNIKESNFTSSGIEYCTSYRTRDSIAVASIQYYYLCVFFIPQLFRPEPSTFSFINSSTQLNLPLHKKKKQNKNNWGTEKPQNWQSCIDITVQLSPVSLFAQSNTDLMLLYTSNAGEKIITHILFKEMGYVCLSFCKL